MNGLFEGKNALRTTQYAVCLPNRFICDRSAALLPAWSQPISSIVLVLQRSQCSLLERTADTERVKDELRQRFFEQSVAIERWLTELGYLTELFDPLTGLPTRSTAGQMRLDDVALIHSLLGYPVLNCGGCSVLLHPIWGDAVYPSSVFTSAPLRTLNQLVSRIALAES